jgi:hypothetical protein
MITLSLYWIILARETSSGTFEGKVEALPKGFRI